MIREQVFAEFGGPRSSKTLIHLVDTKLESQLMPYKYGSKMQTNLTTYESSCDGGFFG